MPGRSRNDQVLAALRLYMRDAATDLEARRDRGGGRARCLGASATAIMALPGYTHMQQAMPSSVALWAAGFAAELRDDAEGLAFSTTAHRQEPVGVRGRISARRISTINREATRRRLGFAVTQEPVTAVQLSRGKAEAQLLFEITLLAQDLARLAADLLLFYTQEFGYVSLPESFTTGSSIMPQKRNPDVFELMRGRSAVAQAALNEVLGITQKLTSGYHRDLQLIKPPLVPRHRFLSADLGDSAERARRRALSAGEHPARSAAFTPPPRRMRWWPRKAFRFARPTGAWPQNSRINE